MDKDKSRRRHEDRYVECTTAKQCPADWPAGHCRSAALRETDDRTRPILTNGASCCSWRIVRRLYMRSTSLLSAFAADTFITHVTNYTHLRLHAGSSLAIQCKGKSKGKGKGVDLYSDSSLMCSGWHVLKDHTVLSATRKLVHERN